MAKELTNEYLKWTLDINGKPAQKQLSELDQKTKQLDDRNKSLEREMRKLEVQMRKNPEKVNDLQKEYDKLNNELKENKRTIRDAKDDMKGLRKQVGINEMTARDLRKEYKRLRQQMDNTNPNTQRWKDLNGRMGAVTKRLNEVKGTARKSDSTFGKLTKTLGGVLAGGAVVEGFRRLTSNVVQTRAEFEKYNAILENTLGSESEAKQVMKDIQDFASSTPYSVRQLTSSFVNMANRGFEPNIEQMRKLGDLASATGKSYNQLVEALLDAQVGEFERLKEFGIRAKQQGEEVTFTYKNQKKTVDKTSESIQDYILSLGDAEGVAGSMEKISNTLTGRISNMGDKMDRLFNMIGKRGGGAAIKNVIGLFGNLVDTVSNFMEIPIERKLEKESTRVDRLAMKLTNANTEERERKRILNKLNDINPKITEGLDAQNINTKKLKDNLQAYNEELTKRITLENLSQEEKEKAAELSEAINKKEEARIYLTEKMMEANKDLALSEGTFEERLKRVNEYLEKRRKELIEAGKWDPSDVWSAGEMPEEISLLYKINQEYDKYTEHLGKVNKLEGEQKNLKEKIEQMKEILGIAEDSNEEFDKYLVNQASSLDNLLDFEKKQKDDGGDDGDDGDGDKNKERQRALEQTQQFIEQKEQEISNSKLSEWEKQEAEIKQKYDKRIEELKQYDNTDEEINELQKHREKELQNFRQNKLQEVKSFIEQKETELHKSKQDTWKQEKQNIEEKYNARIEKARKAGAKIATIERLQNMRDKEMERAKAEFERREEEKRLQFMKQYGLISQKELMQKELQQLKDNEHYKNLTVEQQEKARKKIREKYTSESYSGLTQMTMQFAKQTESIMQNAVENNENALLSAAESFVMIMLDVLKRQVEMAITSLTVTGLMKSSLDPTAMFKAAAKIAAVEAAFGAVKGFVSKKFDSMGNDNSQDNNTNQTNYASQADSGRYNVVGEEDGKTYKNVPYQNTQTGIMNSGKPTLINETGGEMIIDPATTRNIQLKAPEVMDAIQSMRVPQRAAGNLNENTGAPDTTQLNETVRQVAATNEMLANEIKGLREGVPAIFSRKEIRTINEESEKMNRIRRGDI